MTFDFEKGIPELEARLADLRKRQETGKHKLDDEIARLESRLDRTLRQTYQRLGAWQKLLVARHPGRPGTRKYLDALVEAFTPLAGAQPDGDVPTVIGGLGRFRGFSVVVVGQDQETPGSDHGTHWGSEVEGYRVAARLQRLADAFHLPTVAFIHAPAPGEDDTPLELESAVENVLATALGARGPRVAAIVGEGRGRGAVALAVADRVLMLEHAVLYAAAPERVARLQWGEEVQARTAADALKITARDLLAQGIIDEIVAEPPGGAHRNPDAAAAAVGDAVERALRELAKLPDTQRYRRRRERYLGIGLGEPE